LILIAPDQQYRSNTNAFLAKTLTLIDEELSQYLCLRVHHESREVYSI